MVSALELIEKYTVKKNEAVEAFVDEVNRIKAAIDKNRVSGRSPVRSHGKGFKFSLLGNDMAIDSEDTAKNVLDKLLAAAHDENDVDFRTMIELHHGSSNSTSEAAPKRRRRKKGEAAPESGDRVGNG